MATSTNKTAESGHGKSTCDPREGYASTTRYGLMWILGVQNDWKGRALTVNGERYRDVINDFLWPEMEGMDLDGMWFQQDGATCHQVNETFDLPRTKFPGCLI